MAVTGVRTGQSRVAERLWGGGMGVVQKTRDSKCTGAGADLYMIENFR
jgi:hypothetical protein